jgi:hypothetical protein
MLHVIAVADTEVLDPAVGTADVHLPPLGASSVGAAIEVAGGRPGNSVRCSALDGE